MSVYRLCWKAIYCKARLETRLECRQCRLQSIQQPQNNVLKTEMAVGIVIESQPQSLLFQRSFTSTTTGGTRLRSCFHPCFHAWLKYKEIKYPWTCRWHCMKVRGREMPFPFVLSRQGENQSGQDSCFLIKLILQKKNKIPTFTWLFEPQRAPELACHKPGSSSNPYFHIRLKKHHHRVSYFSSPLADLLVQIFISQFPFVVKKQHSQERNLVA